MIEKESVIKIIIAVVSTLISGGGFVMFLLNRRFHLKQEKRKVVLPLVNMLRQVIPSMKQAIEQVYFYPSALAQYENILRKYEMKAEYMLLPDETKKMIESTTNALIDFMQKFRAMRIGLYKYFETMPNKLAGGGFKQIAATKLVCMKQNELPCEMVLVNFPRDTKSVFSQARLDVNQIQEIWKIAQEKLSANELIVSQSIALERLSYLNNGLKKLQRL